MQIPADNGGISQEHGAGPHRLQRDSEDEQPNRKAGAGDKRPGGVVFDEGETAGAEEHFPLFFQQFGPGKPTDVL